MMHIFLLWELLLLHLTVSSQANLPELHSLQNGATGEPLGEPRRTLQRSRTSSTSGPLSIKGLKDALSSEEHCKNILNVNCPYSVYQLYRPALCRFPLDKIPEFFFERLPVNKFFEHDQTAKSKSRSDFVLPRLYERAVATQSINGTLPTNQTKHIMCFFHDIQQNDVIDDTFFYTVLPLAVSLNAEKVFSMAQIDTLVKFGLNFPQSSLLEPKCFLLWILAFQLEGVSCEGSSTVNSAIRLHVRDQLDVVLQSVEASVESIKSTHQDLYNLYKQLLHVNFLQASRNSRSYPQTVQQYFAQRGEINWLKGVAEMLELWPFSEHPYGKCSTFSRVAYRLLAYISAFNPIDSAEIRDAREELFVMVASSVKDNEMSTDEIKLILAISLYTKVFELPEAFVLIRPGAIFAGTFKEFFKNIPHTNSNRLKPSTLFHVSWISKWGRPVHMATEAYFLERAKNSFKKCDAIQTENDSNTTSDAISSPQLGTKRLLQQTSPTSKIARTDRHQICREHFLPESWIYCPSEVAHQPRHALSKVVDRNYSTSKHVKEFILPSLNENMLTSRVEHFKSHQTEGPTGDRKWREMSPNHSAFDEKISVFVEKMFSALGWLAREPQNDAYIYFEDSHSYGDGLEKDAFSTFSEVIMLPFVGIFRYDDKLEGLLPLPMLSPTYMTLLAEFQLRMLKLNLHFQLPLAQKYIEFLSYSESFELPIRAVIEQLYMQDFNSLKALATARLTEYYPSVLRTHIPIALDYPVEHVPAAPFWFGNPYDELETWGADNPMSYEAWKKLDPSAASTSSPEFTKMYTEMVYFIVKKHALLGRFEYQRQFLSRIRQERWPYFSFNFFEKLMRGIPRVLTADELYKAFHFKNMKVRVDGKPFEGTFAVIDDDQAETSSQSPPDLSPEEAIRRVLSSYSPKMLLKLLWFCTGCRQAPFDRLVNASISIELRAPSLPKASPSENATARVGANGPTFNLSGLADSTSRQACPLPLASTCHRIIYWTVQPRLSEVRWAFNYVLENASGFTIDELRASQIAAHTRAQTV